MPLSEFGNDPALDSLLAAELTLRLRAGEPLRVETFLDRFPSLRSDPVRAAALVHAEWLTRRDLGLPAPAADYYARFPQWRDRLEQLFADKTSGAGVRTVARTTLDGAARSVPRGPQELPCIDRYEIAEVLGAGSMGVVYRARDTELDRWVALKVIRAGDLARPEEVERFRRETLALAALDHPHIVRVFDLGTHADLPYYTMALAYGGSLEDHRGRFGDEREAVVLVEKLARAVGAAHAGKVIHRDLKPANILFDDSGEPLIADFGLVKIEAADLTLTATEQLMGTPAYMAPEQAAGAARRVTPSSDVWSLGVILYELLTGSRPFTGDDRETLTLRVRTLDPLPPRRLRPALSTDLEAIALHCLRKDPDERYPDGTALANDLRNWLEGRTVEAEPESWTRSAERAVLRAAGRWPAAVTLGSLLSLFVATLGFAPAPATVDSLEDEAARRRDLVLADLSRDFDAGRAIRLVADKGPPRYFRWRTEINRPAPERQFRTPFELMSSGICLADVYPDVGRDRFRFGADVRVLESHRSAASAGIYFGCDEKLVPGGSEERFALLRFGEHSSLARTPEYLIARYRWSDRWDSPPDLSELTIPVNDPTPSELATLTAACLPGMQGPFPAASVAAAASRCIAPTEWHRLELEVTPEAVAAFMDGAALCRLPRNVQDFQTGLWWANLDPKSPSPTPSFGPRGALGLWLRWGWAEFRNVTLTPLDTN